MSFPRVLHRHGFTLGLAMAFAAAGTAAGAENTCVSAKCHATILSGKVVHAPHAAGFNEIPAPIEHLGGRRI